ncbi:MAG: hypothetical protein OEW67_03820 [Cyclobacteriaceae bacterium]|nr:hypothetical protein [Cyclobacteriaceae bacterium]
MKTMIRLIALILLATSCSDELTENSPDKNSDKLILRDQSIYESTLLDLEQNKIDSDLFALHEVSVADKKLQIKVSYSGGCQTHKFQIIWPEVITMIYPPDFSVVLMHDNNGDMCEAYFTETIIFDLINDDINLSDDAINEMRITVINGSNPDEIVSNR